MSQDKLLQNGISLYLITILSSIGGFLFWAIAARNLESDQVGIASSIISAIALTANLSGLGLGVGVIRYIHEAGNPNLVFRSTNGITLIFGLFAGTLYVILLPWLSPSLSSNLNGFLAQIVFVVLVLAIAQSNFLLNYFLAFRLSYYGSIQILIQNLVKIVVLLFLSSASSIFLVGITAISFIIADAIGLFVLLPKLPPLKSTGDLSVEQIIPKILKYSFLNHLASNLLNLPIFISPILALEFLNESASAYLYIAWTITLFVSGPGGSLGNSALAEVCHSPDQTKQILARALAYAAASTMFLSVVVLLGSNIILGFFGNNYVQYTAPVLRLLVIAAPIVSVNAVLSSYLRYQQMNFSIVMIALITCLVALVLPNFFILQFGISSFGYSYLASQIICLGMITIRIAWKNQQILKLELPL